MKPSISILGAGSWGSAIAISMSQIAQSVTIWSREQSQVTKINTERINPDYLPDTIIFPAAISATFDLAQVLTSDLLIIATPVSALTQLLTRLKQLKPELDNDLIWLCKGFCEVDGEFYLPHQIINKEYADKTNFAALLGPSFALEVAQNLPTAVTLASGNQEFCNKWLKILQNISNFRIYANADLIGAEVGAGAKNIVAIAVGIADGLNLGYNARAGLITRSISELKSLVVALGGKTDTLYGLSGVGDLILTCTGNLSRNRQVGLALAQGEELKAIINRLGHVAEGVLATRAVFNLAQKLNLNMPIVATVYAIIYQRADVKEQIAKLLARKIRME